MTLDARPSSVVGSGGACYRTVLDPNRIEGAAELLKIGFVAGFEGEGWERA